MEILNNENLLKLKNLNNQHVLDVVHKYIELLKPSTVKVITDSDEDINYVREKSIECCEEKLLKMKGHTVHFDNYYDQARDKANTKVLVTKDHKMSKVINTKDRDEGLEELSGIMENIMEGKEMIVRFFVLGPIDSKFSICALQITDSYYVAHSEDILYRNGYEQFKKLNGSNDFFLFVHSAGKLEDNVTKNIDKRRIYIDLSKNAVYTFNNQYAGNSLGLKKLALRLGIYKANNEDWLTEHMFIMGMNNKEKKRTTYFCGAYPSACGKTSTAMIPSSPNMNFTIIGDDIAYIKNFDGKAHAANIEQGIFGIIKDVNPVDDPLIYEVLTSPRELIFSNILVNDGGSYWLGMGKELPNSGRNHSGKWVKGNKDKNGKEIPYCHPNARYTIRISELANVDTNEDNPNGVQIEGIFYGGRDSDTSPPVYESLNWEHGVFIGATVESESTSATLGAEGVRTASPMANMDFLVVPLGKYLGNHQKFGSSLKKCPKVFATNYFLKSAKGQYLNEKVDKKVWVIWAEGRIHGDYSSIQTPIGNLPKYDDLKKLFKTIFDKEYSKNQYQEQFSIRIERFLEKLDRMEKMYKQEPDIPEFFWNVLNKQRQELKELKEKNGKTIVSPFEL